MDPCEEESFFEGGMEKKKERERKLPRWKNEIKSGCKYSCNSIYFGLLVWKTLLTKPCLL